MQVKDLLSLSLRRIASAYRSIVLIISMSRSPRKSSLVVAFVGSTGVGKSTLLRMLGASAPANNNAEPCTKAATPYKIEMVGRSVTLWDTRGLDEASTGFLLFRLLKVPKCEKALKKFLGENTVHYLVWCIEMSKITEECRWKQFRKIFVDFCKKRSNARPVVVVTQMHGSYSGDWRKTCREQLNKLRLPFDANSVPLASAPRTSGDAIPQGCGREVRELILDWT